MKSAISVLLLVLAMFVNQALAASTDASHDGVVLFSDNFDSHAVWSPAQTGVTRTCIKGQKCEYPVPAGYHDYRIDALSRCSKADNLHNTLNIDGSRPRGGEGNSLLFWSEPCYNASSSWGSDGLLGVAFPPEHEVYVRYWIMFQPDWKWSVGKSSPQQKFLHISHLDKTISGEIWDFFSGRQNKPRAIPQFAKWGGGTYRTQLMWLHSPLSAQRDNSRSFNTNVYFGPAPLDWNNAGAPGDGQWHCLEYYVRLNSSGGVADGVSRTWYDGVLIHESKNIPWLATGDSPDDFKWNHVWLGGNNSNLVMPSNEQWYALDDVVVSTFYSGPPPKPVNVAAKTVNGGTVRISWDAGKNGANYRCDGYRIYYGTSPSGLDKRVDVGNRLSHDLQGLASGKYYFTVSAYNKGAHDRNENESQKSDFDSVRLW